MTEQRREKARRRILVIPISQKNRKVNSKDLRRRKDKEWVKNQVVVESDVDMYFVSLNKSLNVLQIVKLIELFVDHFSILLKFFLPHMDLILYTI